MRNTLLLLISGLLFGFSSKVSVADELLEHPVIKPIDGSRLLAERSSKENYGMLKVAYKGEDGEQSVAEGVSWKLVYQVDSLGREEIKANYMHAVQEIGGKSYGLRRATRANFRIPTLDGGVTWLSLTLKGNGLYELEIVDEALLEVAVKFDAASLGKELREHGRVSVYEILFATDSDRLLPGSGAALDVISEMLLSDLDLSVEVQGHTDAVGSPARNKQLSNDRAIAVKAALELFGVLGSRMRAVGHGSSMPLGDNATEEGRQRNRRVDFALLGQKASEH